MTSLNITSILTVLSIRDIQGQQDDLVSNIQRKFPSPFPPLPLISLAVSQFYTIVCLLNEIWAKQIAKLYTIFPSSTFGDLLSHYQVPPHRFESPRLQAIQAESLGLQRPRPSSCFESMTSCYIFWPYRSYLSLVGGAQLSCSNRKLKARPQQNSCWRAARTTRAWEDLPPKVRVK